MLHATSKLLPALSIHYPAFVDEDLRISPLFPGTEKLSVPATLQIFPKHFPVFLCKVALLLRFLKRREPLLDTSCKGGLDGVEICQNS
jgi:hypothetical protein